MQTIAFNSYIGKDEMNKLRRSLGEPTQNSGGYALEMIRTFFFKSSIDTQMLEEKVE